jgi:N-acetylmuramoyl-L-alanine amidase
VSLRKQISAIALLFFGAAAALSAAPPRKQANLAAARRQFQRAQKLEAALGARVGGTRTEVEYLKVIKAYRRVALITPAGQMVAPSLLEVGRLYSQMGHLFDSEYFQKAVDTYLYLVRNYPHARLVPHALYNAARLEEVQLGNPGLGRRYLRTLVEKYPSSDQADRARLELARHPAPAKRPDAHKSEPKREPSRARSGPESSSASASGLTSGRVEGGEESSRTARVRSIVYRKAKGEVRIVIALSGPVKFRSARIARPERVYFDLTRAYLVRAHGETLTPRSRLVTRIRVAQNRRHVVRVVLNIGRHTGYAASLLRHPYRLVIRVGRLSAGARSGEGEGANTPSGSAAQPGKGNLTPARPLRSGEPSLTRALGLKIFRIVIDPGHGGFDTGTIGPNGLEEKTVALSIALRLGRLIERRLPGTKVIYTRKTDVFVPLEKRTQIANRDKADLFISIHANSSPDRHARGVEAYYLNFTTSQHALAVAARENSLAQEPVHKLRNLLQKISLNDKIDESREFAADVDHSLVHELRLGHVNIRDRGVKKAPFVVLIGAHMPSILVEVSFLSNPTDDRLLGKSRYRDRIARGIFDGIRRYIKSLNSLSYEATKQASTTRR